MSSPVSIRAASIDDAAAIADLLGQLGYPATADEAVARLARIDRFRDAVVLVAEVNGEVAGLVTCHILPSIHMSAPVAWLTTLIVDDKHQRAGIGRDLTRAVESWARDHGATRISVTSGKQRAGAHAFYEGFGYEHTGMRFTKVLT
jgi:predicted N-acetyltransferase YhbS